MKLHRAVINAIKLVNISKRDKNKAIKVILKAYNYQREYGEDSGLNIYSSTGITPLNPNLLMNTLNWRKLEEGYKICNRVFWHDLYNKHQSLIEAIRRNSSTPKGTGARGLTISYD